MILLISTPGGTEWILLGIVLAYWAIIIKTIIDVLNRKDLDLTPRLLWTLIILVAPLIGLLLYNFIGKQNSHKTY
jgi:hypothetical protein